MDRSIRERKDLLKERQLIIAHDKDKTRNFNEVAKDFAVGVATAESGFKNLDSTIKQNAVSAIEYEKVSQIRSTADLQQVDLQKQLAEGTITLSEYQNELNKVFVEAGAKIQFLQSQLDFLNVEKLFGANLATNSDLLSASHAM